METLLESLCSSLHCVCQCLLQNDTLEENTFKVQVVIYSCNITIRYTHIYIEVCQVKKHSLFLNQLCGIFCVLTVSVLNSVWFISHLSFMHLSFICFVRCFVFLHLICYHFYVPILFIRSVIMFIVSVCYHIFAPLCF